MPPIQSLQNAIDDYINLKPIVDEYLDLNVENASEKHMIYMFNIALKEYMKNF
jgi:hypothetical protein